MARARRSVVASILSRDAVLVDEAAAIALTLEEKAMMREATATAASSSPSMRPMNESDSTSPLLNTDLKKSEFLLDDASVSAFSHAASPARKSRDDAADEEAGLLTKQPRVRAPVVVSSPLQEENAPGEYEMLLLLLLFRPRRN